MCKNCKNCASANWILVDRDYYNLKCKKCDNRLIECCISKNVNIVTPTWCPENATNSKIQIHPIYGTPIMNPHTSPNVSTTVGNQKKSDDLVTIRTKWQNIEPQIKWDDIKKGDIYHVPPFIGSKDRFDIEVIYSCGTYFSYKKLGEYASTQVYKNDLIYKVMVKSKTKIAQMVTNNQ